MPMIAPTLDEALAPITDGIMLAVPREVAGLPTSTLQADLLIGAGAIATLETSAVSLGEFGAAPRFTDAIVNSRIRMLDATCPALHAAFQAAEKGVPFMPLRGILGSDLLKHRPDWRVMDNPFGNDDPIVLLPAIKPDVALLHAPMADRAGNVWIGRQRELATMAHAAQTTVVTVEKIFDGDLLADPVLAAGVLPGFYVERIAVAENGCWPLGLPDHYAAELAHLAEYARMAATGDGFAKYLEQHVYARKAA
jgi:glutaconate CoA-transferase subunit A